MLARPRVSRSIVIAYRSPISWMVVRLVKNAPHWATGSKLLGAVPLGVTLPIYNPSNLWAAFIKKLVSYYGEKWGIHHWIISPVASNAKFSPAITLAVREALHTPPVLPTHIEQRSRDLS